MYLFGSISAIGAGFFWFHCTHD